MPAYSIRHYVSASGKDPFLDWLRGMRDPVAKVQVMRRINRLEQGNFGDHRFCRDGVWELRIDTGPGYRVYYARAGATLVLLLAGGEKRTQDADIVRAAGLWQDWQERNPDENDQGS